MTAVELLDTLNSTYTQLHTSKEDAFWAAYMGLEDDASAARATLDTLEIEVQRFLRDPKRLTEVREVLAGPLDGADDDALVALKGWERTFAAHAIDSEDGRALAEEIVGLEGDLARARGSMKLGYTDPKSNAFVAASSVKLATLIANDPDEGVRKAAWEGMRSIEPHVLANGFLDVVKKRNRLGRMLGAEDYYDWKVQGAEGMTKTEVFALLDELEVLTRDAGKRAVQELSERVGAKVTPWNVRYLTQGDVTKAQDPYFSFEASLGRWGRSFAALGIRYRGAKMSVDLVDRKGKYENGFMHGPEISWREKGSLHPARIQFTANAIPGMTGSGQRATRTLFHEGGHAAHFANIDMPAPCFGQEFAPTSVAFAETQSMFLDSLLNDADWQQRYAKNAAGEAIPWALIEDGIRARQPFAAWTARAMLAVCYAEKAIYELPEDELTPERVLEVLRAEEKRLLFLDEGSPRPVLAVPHLLAGESSAYYHGYVMAEMGVHQTREFFLERDGHLTDNPKIGPALAESYWRPGNSMGCSPMVERLTGVPLGAAALAKHVNRSTDEALEAATACAERGREAPVFAETVDLEAHVSVVHGRETVAVLEPGGDFDAFAGEFATWIAGLAATSS